MSREVSLVQAYRQEGVGSVGHHQNNSWPLSWIQGESVGPLALRHSRETALKPGWGHPRRSSHSGPLEVMLF